MTVSQTRLQSRIATITAKLQSRFKPENYGYAKAIKSGTITVNSSRLSVTSPSLSCDSSAPLPSYHCGTAARLAHRMFQLAGIDSHQASLSIPINNGISKTEDHPIFGHGVCMVSDNGQEKIIDLTSPLNQFFGLTKATSTFPVAINSMVETMNPAITALTHFTESTHFDLDDANESCPELAPLSARLIDPEILGVSFFQVARVEKSLRMHVNLKILIFDAPRRLLGALWDSDILIGLPLTKDFDKALGVVRRYSDTANPVISAVSDNRMGGYQEKEFPFKDERLRPLSFVLLNEAWPAIVQFFEKVPVADIQAITL